MFIILSLLILLVLLAFLVRQPRIQTFIANEVTKNIAYRTHSAMGIKTININLLHGFTASGVFLNDTSGNPILNAGSLEVKLNFFELLTGRLNLHSVKIDSLDFRLYIPPGDKEYTFIQFLNFLLPHDTVPGKGTPFKLKIDHLDLNNVRFQLKNSNAHNKILPHTIDFENLQMNDGRILADKFSLVDDSIHFILKKFSAVERSGFKIINLKSDIIVSPKIFVFNGIDIKTNHSHLKLNYSMRAKSWNTYAYYIDSVRMNATLKKSILDMSDLGYFAQELFDMKNVLKINGGKASGTVNNFHAKNMNIGFGEATNFTGNVSMKGLPDFFTTQITGNISKLKTTVNDIQAFLLPQKMTIQMPKIIQHLKDFNISGNFNGYYDNFISGINIQSPDSGIINFDISLFSKKSGQFRLGLDVKARDFPLNDMLLKSIPLGKVTLEAALRYNPAHPGKNNNWGRFYIHSVDFLGYSYHKLAYHGFIDHEILNNNLQIDDPNLKVLINGITKLNKVPSFNYKLKINKADFASLGIWEEKKFHIVSEGTFTFKGMDLQSLIGSLSLRNTHLIFDTINYPVKTLIVKKSGTSNRQHWNLISDLLNVQMTGDFDFGDISFSIQKLLHSFYKGVPYFGVTNKLKSKNLALNVQLWEPEIIGEQFIKGLNISPNTMLEAQMNFYKPSIKVGFNSNLIKYQGIEFRNNLISANGKPDSLKLGLNISHLILKDSTKKDKSVFGLDSLAFKLKVFTDSLRFAFDWDNLKSKKKNIGEIDGVFSLKKNSELLKFSKTRVFVNDTLWWINPKNRMFLSPTGWEFKNFTIHGGNSLVDIKGKIPEKSGDSLEIVFSNWNLSNLDMVWHYAGFDLDGIINGYLNMTKTGKTLSRVGNLTIKGLSFNKTGMGTAYLLSTWDNVNNSAFIKSQVIKNVNGENKKIFGMDGFYFPYRDTSQLDLNISLNTIKINGINSFVREYVTELNGKASGKIHLFGLITKPEFRGYITLDSTSLKVNYLNTKYFIPKARFTLNKNDVDFGNFILRDTLGNIANVSGKLLFPGFKNTAFDVSVNTKRLLFFNTQRKPGDVYYGTAIASGNIFITGPVDNINLNINASTDAGTSVILPLDYTGEISDKKFISFVKPPLKIKKHRKKVTVLNIPKPPPSQYEININMNVNPNALLTIFLPYGLGNIQSQGQGGLNLSVNSAGNVSLAGDYIVDKGSFDLTLADFIKKHFSLVKGGRISWTGDPYKATVNLRGLYKVKADLSTLGVTIDTTSNYRNRVNVDCYVVLTKDLLNPQMKFQIKFPDLDPDLQRMAYAQLDTTNQALMNQEMISLLVLKSFVPNNRSNVNLTSSYYNILTNQLSGLLSSFSQNLDVGLSYNPGSRLTKEEFDVALSTQLFDERLVINGNFGMSYDRQKRSASNLVGDVDIGYKLTKDGTWMLKAFNHSNVNSWYYYNNYDKISPYTQGVGIAFQKSFNNIAEIFGKRKKKKHKSAKKNK